MAIVFSVKNQLMFEMQLEWTFSHVLQCALDKVKKYEEPQNMFQLSLGASSSTPSFHPVQEAYFSNALLFHFKTCFTLTVMM